MSKKTSRQIQQASLHLLSAFQALPKGANSAGDFIALPDVVLPDSGDTLLVSILFGTAGQTGSATISLLMDKSFKDVFIKGSTDHPIPIKPCNLLDGEQVIIVSEVTDANRDRDNNITEIIVELSVNGQRVYRDDHKITVENEGDTARFIYKISCHVL